MILENELEIPLARRRITRWRTEVHPSSASRNTIVFVSFFLVIVLLQILSGAYHSEFGGYPDEPAHYVTSLMVHDYITGFHWFSPIQFAQQYYHYYPKVAIGHWPPFFYFVQAIWMTVFSASRASILLQLAFTTALLGYSVYLEARRWFNGSAGVLAGLLTICLPLVQRYSDEEMAETLLALTCLWSAIYFARYLDSERWQDSFGFALFFSLAVLTKGSGWLLVLLPPLALLLTRKLRLVGRPSFWLAIVTVAALCLPWQLFTMRMVEVGWVGGSSPNVGYTITALGEFLVITSGLLGLFLSALALLGIVNRVLLPLFRGPIQSSAAVMISLVIADWVFHSLIPAGIEDRKLIMAVPALVLFVFAGGFWIAERLRFSGFLTNRERGVMVAAGALCFCIQTFAIPHETHYGYSEAARFITSDSKLDGAKILVSSESGGEGMLISEMAMREPRPSHVIIRGTKGLAQVDWNASQYRSYVSSPSQVVEYLQKNHIEIVVVDTLAAQGQFLHDELIKQAIKNSGLFRLIKTFPDHAQAASGQIQLYRFTISSN